MSTGKVKRKQIKDFAHEIDDHKASPEAKRGKVPRTHKTTGEIEMVKGARRVSIGTSGYINNVDDDFQVEFYIKIGDDLWQMTNIYYEYNQQHRHIFYNSEKTIDVGIAVIKEL